MRASERAVLFSPIQRGRRFVRSLLPAAWFRYGIGITKDGSDLVSQWDDQSGNGRHLKQSTDTNKPTWQSDGSILFDGVDNYLKCDAFTFEQPETIYILFKQVTWTSGDDIFDGNAASSGRLNQRTTTPNLAIMAGAFAANNTGLAVDTYGAVCAVFNGASSLLQVDNGTATTGDPGAADMGGFTLGVRGDNTNGFSSIQVKEVILFPDAHDAGTRARVIRYLLALNARGKGA